MRFGITFKIVENSLPAVLLQFYRVYLFGFKGFGDVRFIVLRFKENLYFSAIGNDVFD